MPKILSVGLDGLLLHTRNLVLHQSGAEVFSARAEAALVLLDSQYFDLLVLCHTLSSRDIVRICRLVKLFWPRSRMLMVSKIGDTHMQTCDPDIVFPWRTGRRHCWS